MTKKKTILVVEDDGYIANVLKSLLEANDYRVLSAESGNGALQLAASHVPDAVLLDLGLPDIDGTSVLTSLRMWYEGPIIVVSARNQVKEKVQALDMGADDYINKPFSASELLARIRVALRQAEKIAARSASPDTNYSVGDLTVDFQNSRVYVAGNEIHLTRLEYRIVELLARNPGKVLTHDYIISSVWGPYAPSDNNLILRVNIANIRRKIEKDHNSPRYILAEIGVGYRMADSDPAANTNK
jgi:two-component system, OmpR family, KDP operon response regulator KdpE